MNAFQFCSQFVQSKLGQITTLDIETFSARRHPLLCLKRFFSWCLDKAKFLTLDPSAGVQLPPGGRRSRTLQRIEKVRYRRGAPLPLRRFLLAVEESGARPQEWRKAGWENVHLAGEGSWTFEDLEAGNCLLRLDVYKGQARRENPYLPREIPISARLGRMLARIGRGKIERRGPILLSASRSAWTANALRCSFRRLRARFEGAGDKDKERVVIYSYRHTLATELARRGVNGRILADFLGHASLDLLGWYVHPSEEDLCNLLKRTKKTVGRRVPFSE